MEQICLVLPVQPGQADGAREFMRDLEATRNGGICKTLEDMVGPEASVSSS
jgi:hypothetical protein